jgi:hypothetical protein
MRWWNAIGIGLAFAACSYEHGVAPDAAIDPGITDDGAPLPCAMKRVWSADFSADPTTLNLNGDPVSDWRIREGGGLPGLLSDGVWSVAGAPMLALDTQPKTDFNRRMRATARMRNTVMGTRGVMLWLNVDYSRMHFMPLFFEVRLDAEHGRQLATLFGKDATSEYVIATFSDLGTGMVDVTIDIDPMQDMVTVKVGAASASHVYIPIERAMNDDRFATLAAYSDGEFDEARIELCQ